MIKIANHRHVQVIFLLILIFSTRQSQAQETKPAMQGMAGEIQALKPYIIDSERFLSQQNEEKIAAHIRRLKTMAVNAKHSEKLAQGDYRQTINLLVEHLEDTEKTFKGGHKDLARYMLQSSIQTCIACHSRLPGYENTLSTPPVAAGKKITFVETEFLFATREFSTALKNFKALVEGYPRNGLNVNQLLDGLDYIATIYTRINRDPKGAIETFGKILKNKSLPPFLQEDVKNWLKAFESWQKEPEFNFAEKTDAEVIAKAESILGETATDPHQFLFDRGRQIAFLRASTLLHEFLTARPESPLAAKAYYLLGVCYLSLKHDFFVGFDQMYLRTCIKEYRREPVARDCYKLLEESIYLGYSGSSGTHVPFDVMQELNQFKKDVY